VKSCKGHRWPTQPDKHEATRSITIPPGGKPALNNGFDLFSENPVVRFFPSFVSRKLRKILAY